MRNARIRLKFEIIQSLTGLGVTDSDIIILQNIAKGLHAWDEAQCGDEFGNCVEIDDDNVCWLTSEPFDHKGPRSRRRIPNTGVRLANRLGNVMKRYPLLVSYHQSDCRGWPLYILRLSDIPAGSSINSVYNRGAGIPGQ
jgi:hypothetical protein